MMQFLLLKSSIFVFNSRVKPKVVELYGLKSLEFEAIFAGPEPQFSETQRKQAAALLNKAKKGQVTLDSWIKVMQPVFRIRPDPKLFGLKDLGPRL